MVAGGSALDEFTLGTTFSRPYCVLFDYDKKQMAFAKSLH